MRTEENVVRQRVTRLERGPADNHSRAYILPGDKRNLSLDDGFIWSEGKSVKIRRPPGDSKGFYKNGEMSVYTPGGVKTTLEGFTKSR